MSINEYNYGFFDFKKMTDNGTDIKVNENLPWQGIRKYSVSLKKQISINFINWEAKLGT